MSDKQYLYDKIKQLDITLTEIQATQFLQYYEILHQKNKVMNLTAITEFKDVVIKHFTDSLAVVKAVDMEKVHTVIDIGTGAGFPGIPLKIVFPHLNIVLADSLNKRVKFLQEVINELHLDNAQAVHSRAEDIAHNKIYRDKFDVCVSRAVANMSTLSEYCMPFVKPGGIFVSYKAGDIAGELNSAKKAIKILCGEIEKTVEIVLPDTDIKRTFVNIKKLGETPKAYPRKAGTPSKNPLI